MAYQIYPRPSCVARAKIVFHYMLPQLVVTRAAGWLAQKEWGGLTHALIKLFMKKFAIDLGEAKLDRVEDFRSFNEFFIRELKDGARPICALEQSLCLPADGCVSESGAIVEHQLLQAKGHLFRLETLLAGDKNLADVFKNGVFFNDLSFAK